MGFLARLVLVAVGTYGAAVTLLLFAAVHRIPDTDSSILSRHNFHIGASDMPPFASKGEEQSRPQWTLDGEVLFRFPPYGTEAFSRQCAWTMGQFTPVTSKCTLSGQPRQGNSEGLGMWLSDIVTASVVAQQLGCDLVFDYGPSVQIDSVLVPSSALKVPVPVPITDGAFYNWTVPSGFNCSQAENCFGPPHQNLERKVSTAVDRGETPIADVPRYRFAYSNYGGFWVNRSSYQDVEKYLSGFTLETGMACSLGSLFHLSPTASQYHPGLFTDVLPALRDRNSLVLAVYARTGMTDFMADVEREGNRSLPSARYYTESILQDKADRVVDCAVSIEEKFFLENINATIRRVVWVVLSDSPFVKDRITEMFDGKDLPGRSLKPGVLPKRKVLTSPSRGIHTRTGREPSTADFAEAFLDWYLIGESDVVVSFGGESYGSTAALRTARPFYKECSRRLAVH